MLRQFMYHVLLMILHQIHLGVEKSNFYSEHYRNAMQPKLYPTLLLSFAFYTVESLSKSSINLKCWLNLWIFLKQIIINQDFLVWGEK